MFARFRQVRDRLNVGIVERPLAQAPRSARTTSPASDRSRSPPPRRIGSGSGIKVHQRLATLSNRLDDKTRWAILAAISARIPIPTVEDQEAAKNSGREPNGAFFAVLRDKHRGLADVYRRGAEQATAAAEAVDGLEWGKSSRTALAAMAL
jgi:hypothetical protein